MAANLKTEQRHYYTLQEYFALEKVGDARYEYWDGEIFCMSGGSRQHYRLSSNIHLRLGQRVEVKGCETYTGEMPIKTPKLPPYRYPDASVVCGESQFESINGIDALLNPLLIVEVLSPTTETADRQEKRMAYQAIESLQEYLLIAQDKVEVTCYGRNGDLWFREIFTELSAQISLASINETITVAEIYRGIKFS